MLIFSPGSTVIGVDQDKTRQQTYIDDMPDKTVIIIDDNGNSKYATQNSITPKFSRLIKKAGLKVPKGTGFYTLRRAAATIAARSGVPFGVQRLLGHADLQMATRYVQDVSNQTDKVIENSRKYMI